MARREIPGMYYDEEKNKYFRIQPGHVVPKSAKYTREAITKKDQAKARRSEQEQEAAYVASFGPINRTKAINPTKPTGYVLHRSLQPWARAAPKSQLWATGARFKTTIYKESPSVFSDAKNQLVPFGSETYAIVTIKNDFGSHSHSLVTVQFEKYGDTEIDAICSGWAFYVVDTIVRRDYVLFVCGDHIELMKPMLEQDDGLDFFLDCKSKICVFPGRSRVACCL